MRPDSDCTRPSSATHIEEPRLCRRAGQIPPACQPRRHGRARDHPEDGSSKSQENMVVKADAAISSEAGLPEPSLLAKYGPLSRPPPVDCCESLLALHDRVLHMSQIEPDNDHRRDCYPIVMASIGSR